LVKTVRHGTTQETEEQQAGRFQPELHAHTHEVKYRDKEGNIRDYVYNYGKIGSKGGLVRKVKER
jgi:hypothetical protein